MGIKVAILEKDGIEFGVPTEYDLETALLETLAGLVRQYASNYHIIPEGKEWVIGENHQSSNYGGLELYGQLELYGSLILI